MNSLLYALNSTLPIILIIVVGKVLFKLKLIEKDFSKVTGNFVNKIALPALLFADITQTKVLDNFDFKYLLFCFIVTLVMILALWGLTEIFMKNESRKGAFIQASYRSSAAILGLAFIKNMYSDIGLAPLMIMGSVPLFNIFALLILTLKSNAKKEKLSVLQTVVIVCKNPILISIVVAMIFAFLNIPIPKIIGKGISMVGQTTAPLALLTIGASFKGKSAIKAIKPTLIATFIKLIGVAMVVMPIAIYFGYKNQELMAVLIMVASPTTASAFPMAMATNNDRELTSSIIVLTTLLSAFTLTFWIYIFSSYGLL